MREMGFDSIAKGFAMGRFCETSSHPEYAEERRGRQLPLPEVRGIGEEDRARAEE